MGAFSRDQKRLVCNGLSLNAPADATVQGKFPYLANVRSYIVGTVQARLGMAPIANGVIGGGSVHSITRLNDPTPFAGNAFYRAFGAGTHIYAGNTTYPSIDAGYSGNPLTMIAIAPVAAPEPWVYVGDSSRQRKFDVNGNVVPVGIAPPLVEPSSVLGNLWTEFLDGLGSTTNWVPAGVAAGAISTVSRISTTISSILYDAGTSGNASVVPASMVGINTDAIIAFNSIENVAVQQVTIPIVTTTIAGILYDSGTSGLCTIQPTASLGTGQLDAPSIADYQARQGGYAVQRGTAGTPPVPDVTGNLTAQIRQVDFPVNCLVRINGAETVRILSVSLGPDGIQSFRCSTAGTFSAGQSLVGVSAFRVFTNGTYTGGQSLASGGLTNVITPTGVPPSATGGIKTTAAWTPISNIAVMANGIATLPNDDFHLSVRYNDCTAVVAVRIYLDVDAAGPADPGVFTQNYFFFEWRANDIIAAIQAQNTSPVATLQQVRVTTVGNAQLNTAVSTGPHAHSNPANPLPTPQTPLTPGQATQDAATSAALALGNNQWLELHCKFSDFIRVGTDPSRSMQNICAAEIVSSLSAAAPITVSYGSIWVSGGENPDTYLTGTPRVYAYRYRSSLTGATSNPSPASRGGVILRRQAAQLTGVQSPDPQTDLVDWYTIGGTLVQMTYEGTTSNVATPTFQDNYEDARLSGAPALEYDHFQQWAIADKKRTGVCTVAGSAVLWTGGTDHFNTKWAPGSIIIVNGETYTLRAQPQSTTFLEINENAGAGTGLTFTLPEPTIIGQPLVALWGPDVDNVTYACGDVNNPGSLYWTFPNDPDRTSDANVVLVTSGSEKLQHGFVYDDRPYVFSTDQLYGIVIDSAGNRRGIITPCGRGAWTPWFFCVAPEGTYFGTKDGIFLTSGGSAAVSITDADLYPLFPHDGTVGVAVNGVIPPDFTQTTQLRLAFVEGWIYFDFQDTSANHRTLAYRTADHSWWYDTPTPGIAVRLNATGSLVNEELLGGTDGTIYSPSGFTDNGTAIAAQLEEILNQGDSRLQKLYRDFMLDADLTGANVGVTLGLSNGMTVLGLTTLAGIAGRASYLVNVIPTQGAYGTNIVAMIAWNPVAVGVPLLYVTDVAYQNQVELASSWLSGPTTFGATGYLQVPCAYICYLSTAPITLTLIIDGVLTTYTLPSSGGIYAKQFLWLQARKGTTYQLGAQSAAPFLLFDKDLEVFCQPWGIPNGYERLRPF